MYREEFGFFLLQTAAQDGQKQARVHWLGQNGVGTGFADGLHQTSLVEGTGDHHDNHVRNQPRIFMQAVEHIDAVDARHQNIQNEHIRTPGAHLDQTGITVVDTSALARKPGLFDDSGKQLAGRRIIVENEDAQSITAIAYTDTVRAHPFPQGRFRNAPMAAGGPNAFKSTVGDPALDRIQTDAEQARRLSCGHVSHGYSPTVLKIHGHFG